jgi:cytidine deaminase
MMEFCQPETFQIILAVDEENYKVCSLWELFPFGFGPDNLQERDE